MIRCNLVLKILLTLNRAISWFSGSRDLEIWSISGSGPLRIWTPPDLDPSGSDDLWILDLGIWRIWGLGLVLISVGPSQIWRSENRYYLIILSRARVVGKRPVWWVLHQCYTLFYKGEIAEIRDFGRSKVVQKRVRNRTFAYFDPKIDPFWLRITNLDVLIWSIIG